MVTVVAFRSGTVLRGHAREFSSVARPSFLEMEQRVSVISLGVMELDRSRRFYRAMGWVEGQGSTEEIAFFQVGGLVLGLWDRSKLANDSSVSDSPGWGGVTLAYNTRSQSEVDDVIEMARDAGATIGREPDETFWGGYSGVFVDPEGHPWEVAHNPYWTVDAHGNTLLSG